MGAKHANAWKATMLLVPLGLSVAGCAAMGRAGSTTPAEPAGQPPPPVVVPAPDTGVPPPPSEADLAVAAGGNAEARGEYEAAIDLYRWALVARGAGHQADVSYRLARIYLDPANDRRDPMEARRWLERVLASSATGTRAREARMLLALLDEVREAQDQIDTARVERDTALTQVASLTQELKTKQEELESIRQVLLQKAP